MTVAEIQEYIDEQKRVVFTKKDNEVIADESIIATLDIIKDMLDELEQPIEIDTKKYFETMDKIASEYFRKASEQAKEILKENNK